MDFSTFAKEKLGLSAESFNHSDEKVTYHASCHLCRGLGVKEAPRELIAAAADYVPAAEEEVCCGFGGTYSAKFPEVSAALLRKKLDGIADTRRGPVWSWTAPAACFRSAAARRRTARASR